MSTNSKMAKFWWKFCQKVLKNLVKVLVWIPFHKFGASKPGFLFIFKLIESVWWKSFEKSHKIVRPGYNKRNLNFEIFEFSAWFFQALSKWQNSQILGPRLSYILSLKPWYFHTNEQIWKMIWNLTVFPTAIFELELNK